MTKPKYHSSHRSELLEINALFFLAQFLYVLILTYLKPTGSTWTLPAHDLYIDKFKVLLEYRFRL